jgi:signal peptidase I
MNEQNCLKYGLITIVAIIFVMLSFFLNSLLATSPGFSASIGFKAFKISGGSMQPTLLIGDRILIDLDCYANTDPRRGDLVVFKNPEDPSRDYIKRIVAIPGDTFELKDNKLYIYGQLLNEPYAQYTGSALNKKPLEPVEKLGPYVVPKDKYFMLGDNRDQSIDSRSWGYIDKKLIRGKAIFVYWSGKLDRIGTRM